MFKRIVSYALALVLVLGMLPAADAARREPVAPESVDRCCSTIRVDVNSPDYVRPSYDGKLIDITPQRVADTFAYLEDHYEKRHPEQALDFYTGTAEDRANLLKLAQTITSGCKTAKEKADAIGKWISGNITYDVMTSAYASDTFYRREGNCLSYANLMMFLLRSLGIPAVVGDGWRGDMKESTVDLFNMEGHAWIFVLLNGEWVLYDPLWLDGGTTDRDYMAEWIYFDTVEFVVPVSDGNNLPPVAYDRTYAYCTDGRYYLYSERNPQGVGTTTQFINNQVYVFVSNQCEGDISDGRYYLDEGRDKSTMNQGDVYRDSWVSYGNYKDGNAMVLSYAFPNGMMPDGYTKEYDGKLWYMSYDSAVPILASEDQYWIQDGLVSVKPGFSGQLLGLCWQETIINSSDEDRFLVYDNRNPAVATIDDNGNVTCHAEGYGEIEVRLMRRERDGSTTLLGNDYIQFFVSTEERTPDYRDLSNHTHDLVFSYSTAPTCESWGMDIYKCSGCAYTEESYSTPPLDHDYSYSHTTAPTCDDYGYNHYTCTRCGDTYSAAEIDMLGHDYVREVFSEATCTEMGYGYYECSRCDDEYLEADRPALGHAWNGTECDRCDATRMTPFDDVVESSFYEAPVAWAVEEGITNGISASAFGANNTCNRAQVVTFLWRAAGCPAPASMENPFTDVQVGSFYEMPVLWAVENGITNGTSATTFGPNDPCNRASVVTFLWRAAGKPAPESTDHSFTDVAKGSFYELPVLWAVENGITNGVSATQFGPTASCNRAQVVTFLYRTFA